MTGPIEFARNIEEAEKALEDMAKLLDAYYIALTRTQMPPELVGALMVDYHYLMIRSALNLSKEK